MKSFKFTRDQSCMACLNLREVIVEQEVLYEVIDKNEKKRLVGKGLKSATAERRRESSEEESSEEEVKLGGPRDAANLHRREHKVIKKKDKYFVH